MTSSDPTTAPSTSVEEVVPDESAEDQRTQRRALAAVWLAAGSALAAMIAVGWYGVVRDGGQPPGGDMTGHAAAAEWLRTLPWWDWRGWSDWFFGGQAIGVNYPPLGHALMRFTHPVHGQLAAVAVGLLVLLPWGTIRLTRAVGCAPRLQRVALGAVLVLVAASGRLHWILSGFHSTNTFFGSWPAMLATVLGLFCAAWAARCGAPMACGVVAGVAVLFNATVIPGVAVVCVALLATSGVSLGRALRWVAIAGAAALAVCAWWLVPFLASWDRLVRWLVPLSHSWGSGGIWQSAVLVALGVAAAWAVLRGSRPSRRLGLAAGAGLLATLLAELVGYLRPERWLQLPVLVAALAAGGVIAAVNRRNEPRPVRPAWAILGAAFVIVFVVITVRLEVLPLAVWLLLPRRTWAAAGALAWASILLWVPLVGRIRDSTPQEAPPPAPLELAAAQDDSGLGGFVYLDRLYESADGRVGLCWWGFPWQTTAETEGLIRPLTGLYRETSAASEFLFAELRLRSGDFGDPTPVRADWPDWPDSTGASVEGPATAAILGARWYASCDEEGTASVVEIPGIAASGVTVVPHSGEDEWHRAAVEWWVPVAEGEQVDAARAVPILSTGESSDYLPGQAAGEVSLLADGDTLTVHAVTPGWVWIRVPWDPDWRSLSGTPVRKGGPGHLVVWAENGSTALQWSVPRAIDVAAAVTTGVAALAAVSLAIPKPRSRRGSETGCGRPRIRSMSRAGPSAIGNES